MKNTYRIPELTIVPLAEDDVIATSLIGVGSHDGDEVIWENGAVN